MPFLAPLIPVLMSVGEAVMAAPGIIGGALAAPLAGLGTAIGLPAEIAGPLSTFLSPEIIGGGLGEAFGGTKGLEEGLLGGLTMGGGAGGLGDLLGNLGSMAGLPASLTDVAPGIVGASPITQGLGLGLSAASPFIQSAIAGSPITPVSQPSKTMTPTATAPVGAAPPGGPSGLSLTGNTAPQVGPWLTNFWNPQGMNMPNSTGNMPVVGSAAPATSQLPSATNQQQLTSP